MSFNFRLFGIGDNVQFGVGGPRAKVSGAKYQFRNAADSAFINVQGSDAVDQDDFVTLRDLQNATAGISWKEPVVAATAAGEGDIDLSGGTFVNDGSQFDGVTLANDDRVLVKNQTTATQNGIYVYATGSNTFARSSDLPAGDNAANVAVFASQGTTQADAAFVQTADPAIVGTNNLVFTQFASITPGVQTITSTGSGVSIVENGTGPTAVLRSITNGDSSIAAALSSGTQEVEIIVAPNGITEAKLDVGVGILARQVQVTSANAGGPAVNIGAVLPTGAIVTGSSVNVTTAFDGSADLQLGRTGAADEIAPTSAFDLATIGTYVTEDAVTQPASAQLEALVGGTAVTVGQADIIVFFYRTA